MQLNQIQQDKDSDNDQGFIPSKIIIKQKNSISYKKTTNECFNKKQFIPRYILDGIMRKEPSECYKRFSKFDFLDFGIINQSEENIESSKNLQSSTSIQNSSKTKIKQKLSTPHDKYIASGEYNLVYRRYKDGKFTNEQSQFAKNQVKLDCLRSPDDVNFKQIKPFENIAQKTEEVITQNLNRNSSVRQTLLKFDSRFQCGNLLCAYKSKQQPYKYDLFMQNDTNTNGYNQWFYFSIKNAQVGVRYQFRILNFRKRHSFFREGNKPVVFSLKDSQTQSKSGYSKRAENISYSKSPIIKEHNSKQKFYQLSFELEFSNQGDIYYVSMGLPYSYSKLIHNLNIYEETAKSNGITWTMECIGTTIAGNQVPYLTITKRKDSTEKIKSKAKEQQQLSLISKIKDEDQQNQKMKKIDQMSKQDNKKVILVIARQHPGETWSSYLVDQLLYSLANISCPEVDYLLQNFIIKCIPMINIDGVINGNFRCDLSGIDLNRNWKNPSSILHPQIFSIKNELNNLVQNLDYKVECCFDLHGHSKQYNTFCYSCKTDNIECRVLPYIFQELNQQFHFPFCTFGVSKYKQSTARAVISAIIKNFNVLTIQSSFFASKLNGEKKIFQPQSFAQFSQMIIKGCKSYFSQDQRYQATKQIIKLRLSEFLKYKEETENNISGSDSEPSGDEMEYTQKFEKILPKCLIKQCIEMEKSKRIQKRLKNSKRQTAQAPERSSQLKKVSYNSQHQNRTLQVTKEQSPSKIQRQKFEKIKLPKRPIQQRTISYFKKKSTQKINETIDEGQIISNRRFYFKDLLQKDDKKLPYFPKQKPQMIPMKLKNQSFEMFRDAYNATEKYIKHDESTLDEVRNPRRNNSKKLGIFKEKSFDRQDEFPLLCVLSENKKKNHVEKIKQKKQKNQNDSKNDSLPEKVKTAIQTRTQAIRQLREKNKNSMQLVSKIWRENFTRYGMAFSTFKISK